jgi:hypothetical protein
MNRLRYDPGSVSGQRNLTQQATAAVTGDAKQKQVDRLLTLTDRLCLAPRHSGIPRSTRLLAVLFSNIIGTYFVKIQLAVIGIRKKITFDIGRTWSTDGRREILVGYW